MTTKTPPTFLLSTGSFALPAMYEPVLTALPSHLTLLVPHLPTVSPGRDQSGPVPPPSMYDDAAMLRSHITALADEGKDVVLLAHSYGGVPATESLKGVTKREREAEGKKGGVVRIGYLTCIVPLVGESAFDRLKESVVQGEEPMFTPGEDGWMVHHDVDRTRRLVASDMPKEAAEPWFENWPRHSGPSFIDPLTHAGYKDVAVSYLLCERDEVLSPEFQRKAIKVVEEASGQKVDLTTAEVGHAPNVSAPEKVVEWIVGIAEKEAR